MILKFIDMNPKENIKLFYDFHNEEQPNCKNFIYKGKIILLREVILELTNKKWKRSNYLA